MRWPMMALREHPDFELSIIAGGGHLAKSQGKTLDELQRDGFTDASLVPMYADDTSGAVAATAAGRATLGVIPVLETVKPDWCVVLGDRFEMLGAAVAASASKIPLCHLCGGDITEGAYDDAFRHAITKLSHLHCVSTTDAARCVRQMGEEPWRIHTTGSPGLDALDKVEKIGKERVFAHFDLDPDTPTVLVTHHPTTLEKDLGQFELNALLQVLSSRHDIQIVFTGTNADTGGSAFDEAIKNFVAQTARARFFNSLGQTLYTNAVRHVNAVVGNSSSGLYEVPSLGTPTVNIGSRQDGRLRAASVFDAQSSEASIDAALTEALAFNGRDVENPYGSGGASEKILAALKSAGTDREQILRKSFVRHNVADGHQ